MCLFAKVIGVIIKPSRTELSYISAIYTSDSQSVLFKLNMPPAIVRPAVRLWLCVCLSVVSSPESF